MPLLHRESRRARAGMSWSRCPPDIAAQRGALRNCSSRGESDTTALRGRGGSGGQRRRRNQEARDVPRAQFEASITCANKPGDSACQEKSDVCRNFLCPALRLLAPLTEKLLIFRDYF